MLLYLFPLFYSHLSIRATNPRWPVKSDFEGQSAAKLRALIGNCHNLADIEHDISSIKAAPPGMDLLH